MRMPATAGGSCRRERRSRTKAVNLFPMDNTKSFTEQRLVGHNRWHPDVPAGGERQAR
jgi:hypothetical protein